MKGKHLAIITVLVLAQKILCVSLPSIDELFRNPRITHVSLSLDGEYFAALYSDGDQTSLMTYNIQTKQAGRTGLPEFCDVSNYHWVSNESIIYEMSRHKQWAEAVGVVGRDLKDPKTLIEGRPVTVVDGLVHDKDHALLWFRNAPNNNTQSEDLRVVDIRTGRFGKPQVDFPGRVLAWYTDTYGFPRLARAYQMGHEGKEDIYYRSAIGSSWRKLDFDGQLYFFANPYFSDHVSLKGISYPDSTIWFDSEMVGIQEAVDSRLKQTKNKIIDADTKLTRFLIESYSDIQPTLYSVYDVRSQTIFTMSESMPWITPSALCTMRQMSFMTHDSLRIFGYLTTPMNLKPPYPTVVLLHGGPNVRDVWGFDPEVQLLATRGYAVLQVNYRGSSGFGKRVSYENRFEYMKMHDDVEEATMKAIRAGYIDSNRVAIMGASFGGYLAISGATFDPDLYSCAITNAGVFDWEMQWEHFKDYGNRRYFDEMQELIASKPDSKNFLREASPINSAARIKIPVLIAGGRDDDRVPLAQSRKLDRAMRKAGNKPITFYKFGETHGFHFESNRVKYYEKVLSFLNDNIDRTKRKRK
jgi:dipeptidyl aminopeptidase/acylaminoacyl peptidase